MGQGAAVLRVGLRPPVDGRGPLREPGQRVARGEHRADRPVRRERGLVRGVRLADHPELAGRVLADVRLDRRRPGRDVRQVGKDRRVWCLDGRERRVPDDIDSLVIVSQGGHNRVIPDVTGVPGRAYRVRQDDQRARVGLLDGGHERWRVRDERLRDQLHSRNGAHGFLRAVVRAVRLPRVVGRRGGDREVHLPAAVGLVPDVELGHRGMMGDDPARPGRAELRRARPVVDRHHPPRAVRAHLVHVGGEVRVIQGIAGVRVSQREVVALEPRLRRGVGIDIGLPVIGVCPRPAAVPEPRRSPERPHPDFNPATSGGVAVRLFRGPHIHAQWRRAQICSAGRVTHFRHGRGGVIAAAAPAMVIGMESANACRYRRAFMIYPVCKGNISDWRK